MFDDIRYTFPMQIS